MSALNSPDPCETAPLHKTANEDASSDKVRMKKQLGLIEGVAIILGIILLISSERLNKFFFF